MFPLSWKIVVANKNDFVVVLMTCMKGVSSNACYAYEVSNNIFVNWNNNTIESDHVKWNRFSENLKTFSKYEQVLPI